MLAVVVAVPRRRPSLSLSVAGTPSIFPNTLNTLPTRERDLHQWQLANVNRRRPADTACLRFQHGTDPRVGEALTVVGIPDGTQGRTIPSPRIWRRAIRPSPIAVDDLIDGRAVK